MIDKILSTAFGLWLRSQVEQIETLQVDIVGGDRQIISGYIAKVALVSNYAVYQGLHLRQIQLEGVNIRINLSQVIKGKPLKLLEPVAVRGEVLLTESDLQASLSSALLSSALADFLVKIVAVNRIKHPEQILGDYQIRWQKFAFGKQQLEIQGTLTDRQRQTIPLSLRSGLKLSDHHTLLFSPVQIDTTASWLTFDYQELTFDLGQVVRLEKLCIDAKTLVCSGELTVFP